MTLANIAESMIAAADKAYTGGGQWPLRRLDRGLQLVLERHADLYRLRAWRADTLPADHELEKLDLAFRLPLASTWVLADQEYVIEWARPSRRAGALARVVPLSLSSSAPGAPARPGAPGPPVFVALRDDDPWYGAQTWAYYRALQSGRAARIALLAAILKSAPRAWWDRFEVEAAAALRAGGTNADRCRCVLRARQWIKGD